MSKQNIAQEVADLLKTNVEEAAKGAAALHMKNIPGLVQKEMEGLPAIVRKEMDACLLGNCDAIAERLVLKMPKIEPGTMSLEDITKTVKEAMESGKTPFTVEGHSAHDILDCPTCRPIVTEKLWANEEYRQKIMENICEDDDCRNAITKMFEEKGYGVEENVNTSETWAEKRLRKRAEKDK